MKTVIFYLSYLYFLAVPLLIWALAARPVIYQRQVPRAAYGLMLCGLTVLAYARFIEPRILVVKEHEIILEGCFVESGSARLAVVADLHNGVFPNAIAPARIARRVRSLAPDAALIAGDFTLYLDPARFDDTFAPLAALPFPVYYVLGNHDVGKPGPLIQDELHASLSGLGLLNTEDRATARSFEQGRLQVVGLSELWLDHQNVALLKPYREGAPRLPRIVLTHNPDTVLALPSDAQFDLMIAGHTHGGQINLGPLTCVLVPMACHVSREGLVRAQQGRWRTDYEINPDFRPDGTPLTRQVFVTTGTGMSGLPLRFLMPPRIDLLSLYYQSCG